MFRSFLLLLLSFRAFLQHCDKQNLGGSVIICRSDTPVLKAAKIATEKNDAAVP